MGDTPEGVDLADKETTVDPPPMFVWQPGVEEWVLGAAREKGGAYVRGPVGDRLRPEPRWDGRRARRLGTRARRGSLRRSSRGLEQLLGACAPRRPRGPVRLVARRRSTRRDTAPGGERWYSLGAGDHRGGEPGGGCRREGRSLAAGRGAGEAGRPRLRPRVGSASPQREGAAAGRPRLLRSSRSSREGLTCRAAGVAYYG